MSERFFIRTLGGPHPGTRIVNKEGQSGPEWHWPLPEALVDEGGAYVKTSESQLPPLPSEDNKHLMRGAEYEWRLV